MYQSPDLKRVDVNVKDVFASYACPPDQVDMGGWVFTGDCAGSPEYHYQADIVTAIEMGWGEEGCYTTQNP